MRRLKAYVHIKAPVQTVRDLAHDRSNQWMVTREGLLTQTVNRSWDAAEVDGGTRFTLQMEYTARLPFLEPLVADGYHSAVTDSLNRLKQMAEANTGGH